MSVAAGCLLRRCQIQSFNRAIVVPFLRDCAHCRAAATCHCSAAARPWSSNQPLCSKARAPETRSRGSSVRQEDCPSRAPLTRVAHLSVRLEMHHLALPRREASRSSGSQHQATAWLLTHPIVCRCLDMQSILLVVWHKSERFWPATSPHLVMRRRQVQHSTCPEARKNTACLFAALRAAQLTLNRTFS